MARTSLPTLWNINSSTVSSVEKPRFPTRNGKARDLIALLRESQHRLKEGPVSMLEAHPIIGRTYQRLCSTALAEFMLDAWIIAEDGHFTGFTLVLGTHGPDEIPFVCIRNHIEDGLHLLIGGAA